MRRVPPQHMHKCMDAITSRIDNEELKQQMQGSVDIPKEIAMDTVANKQYIKHESASYGNSYRSPWSQQYFPPSESCTFFPPPQLLELEQKANNLFSQYVQMYYDNAISSVYVTESQNDGFNAWFLVKKQTERAGPIKSSCWDAVHSVHCAIKQQGQKADYRVSSTVLLKMDIEDEGVSMDIGGQCSRTTDQNNIVLPSDNNSEPDMFHLRIIGRMIESNEGILRNDIVENYINKQRQVMNQTRSQESVDILHQKQKVMSELIEAAVKGDEKAYVIQ